MKESWGGKRGRRKPWRNQQMLSAKLRRESCPGSLKMRMQNFPLDPIIRKSPRDFHECTFGEVEGTKVRLQWLE